MKNIRTGSGYDKKQEIEKKLKEKRTEAQRIEALEKEAKESKDKTERIEAMIQQDKKDKKIIWLVCGFVLLLILIISGIGKLLSNHDLKDISNVSVKTPHKLTADEKRQLMEREKLINEINDINHDLREKARIEFMQTDEYKVLQKEQNKNKLLKIEKEHVLFDALENAKKIIRMSIVRHGETVGCKLIYYDQFFRWEAFDNPEGDEKGIIVVHFGYEVWLFVNGKLYPVNGSASVVTPDLPYAKSISFGDIEPYITKKHVTTLDAIFNIKQSIDETYRHKGLDNPI